MVDGLGWELGEHRGRRVVEHGGGIPGFTTSFARFVDDDLTIISLTNQDSKPWDMARAVAELYQSERALQGIDREEDVVHVVGSQSCTSPNARSRWNEGLVP